MSGDGASAEAKRVEDLKNTLIKLLEMVKMHAEGMEHMATALVAFDRRLRALENSPKLKSGIVKPNGFHENPLGKI
jgi:predicted RNase H-like nuclease (RuvC/YqgF family)